VGHKILYGSDFPLLGMKRYRRMLDEAGLDVEDEAALLGGNARDVLEAAGRFAARK
jgi:predicted TIM-barrel fold metal-dependent hydrolase